ncbi:MAG: HlyD family efflux transporter periplasmic adaptor subunit [Pseudomonadota bacterium]
MSPSAPRLVAHTASDNPTPSRGRESGRAEQLLALEADARRQRSVSTLFAHLVNEPRALLGSNVSMLFRVGGRRRVSLSHASNVSEIDPDAPLIRAIERCLQNRFSRGVCKSVDRFCLVDESIARSKQHSDPFAEWLHREAMWVPMINQKNEVVAGLLLLRSAPWPDATVALAERIAETYTHAWGALIGTKRVRRRGNATRRITGLAAVAILLCGFLPVDLTSIAPAQVIAKAPFVVAAPLDGVVSEIDVDPYGPVAVGQPILRFDDTVQRNQLALAERALVVADAKLRRASQAAIREQKAKRELAIAKAERDLAVIERDYAAQLLARTVVIAPFAGIAIYSDRKDWIGRPVSTGERMMLVAEPASVQLRIDVPVADAIMIADGGTVDLFLDAAPLTPLKARVVTQSYHAETTEQGLLAYRVTADLIDNDAVTPHIGWRGTAKLRGREVSLFLLVLRRPIRAARQWLGV